MQLGTHLDALSHLQMGDRGYGGFSVADCPPAGVDPARASRPCPRSSRAAGLSTSVAAGRAMSSGSTTCTDIDVEPGDAVLFHTGWGAHWEDPDRYLSG